MSPAPKFESDLTPSQSNNTPTGSETAYNVVTDFVTGVNVRRQDNKFQAIFIVCSLLLAALVGGILASLQPSWNLPWYGGALIGGFLGLVLGFFASGIFLMIYRAMRHLQGHHD